MVREKRIVSVGAPDRRGVYLVEWQATFTPAEKDVVFNRNSYGGFALRGAAEFSADPKKGQPGWQFLDSEGRDNFNGKTARWAVHHGKAQNGNPAAIAIFDHPDNPRHPTPWQMRRNYPYLNPSFTCKEDFKLPAGESLTLRYGVLVHDGKITADEIDRRWEAFAKESFRSSSALP